MDISKFKTKWFWLRPKNAFYVVDVGLHGGNFFTSTSDGTETYSVEKDANLKGLQVMAVGFLDNDKNNDLVTINKDKNEI